MLTTGSRLGPYEIVSPIGAGGMGEVFKARDTRLDRSVAIKVLPAELAGDPNFKIRFEREAKAISALNHPHICTLYDIGHENGTDFLVMELIEGESLADRLARGPLPLDQVLRYGAQIAEGLDRAHKSGVVHRDLKPGNIMITKAAAKLLDFGLAKPSPGRAHSGGGTAATEHKPLTEEGTIVGTFQYMAPEQLEGEEADARTDIFSLGCVLYEMSTGRRAFEGKSKTSLIAAIVSGQPTPISQIQPLTPPAFEHVVQRCLEKDSDDRWQSAHDIAEELKWISGARSQASAASVAPRRRWQWIWRAAALVLVIAAAGVAAWYGSRAGMAPTMGQRFELQPPDGVGVGESAAQGVMAISPDGEWIAFRGVSDEPGKAGIYLRSTRDLNARRAAPGNTPFFSPDSKWLGFFSDGAIHKVPVKGGEPERICSIERLRGASWGDDGTILFSASEGLLRVSADGGQPETITSPPAGERHYWPHYLPGSKAALLVVHRGGGDSFRTITALSLADRKTRPLVRGTTPQFAGGQIVYGFLGNLLTAEFDLERLEMVGKPRAVLRDVYVYLGSGFTGFGLARSGSLVYTPGTPRAAEAEIVWIDRKGDATAAMPDKGTYSRVVKSPDGTRIVAKIVTSIEDSDLWIYELKRGAWTRLTHGKRADMPIWSPDGQWILFSSAASGQHDIWRVRADGAGAAEKLVATIDWEYPCSVTPDGRTLMFMRQVTASQWDLLTVPLDGSGPEKPFLASNRLEAFASFSPDGRWVAYESDETDSREVHVRPFPGPGPRIPVSAGHGEMVSWSPSGRELFYRRRREILVSVSPTRSDFDGQRPQLLTKGETLLYEWNGGLSASPDGQRLLAIRVGAEAQRQRRLVYIPNWISEVEQIQEREK